MWISSVFFLFPSKGSQNAIFSSRVCRESDIHHKYFFFISSKVYYNSLLNLYNKPI